MKNQKLKADYHMHSRWSDGSCTGKELFSLCAAQGLNHVALVDHDRVDHLGFAAEQARDAGLLFTNGVEISAQVPANLPGAGRKIHILGYGFDPKHGAIEALCAPLRQARHQNTLKKLQRLQALDYPLSLIDMLPLIEESKVLYKQHIMAYLTSIGKADGIDGKVYKELFKGNGTLNGDIEYIPVFDAIRAIREDGGLAVLAHPSLYDSWDLLPRLVEAGLEGIETQHPSLDEHATAKANKLAQEFKLLKTGGSDYHGTYGNEPLPGTYQSPDYLQALA